ncbi:hypothetical protein ACFWIB_38460 [Streptomyces sp. NPDC127051]|uniref:hypothetical protein n=1 Tax=Streptomyces sp. NPDC127051 TaxID=3347119 RepID=UPI0036481DB4
MTDDKQSHDPDALGATGSFPMKAGSLRKNGYVILKGFPCQIVDMSNSGGTISLTGRDIFTGKKYEETKSAETETDVPVVTRSEYVLCEVSDGYLSLMVEATGEMKEHVLQPEGKLGEDMLHDFEDGKAVHVALAQAMGREAVVAYRVAVSQ